MSSLNGSYSLASSRRAFRTVPTLWAFSVIDSGHRRRRLERDYRVIYERVSLARRDAGTTDHAANAGHGGDAQRSHACRPLYAACVTDCCNLRRDSNDLNGLLFL